jgi:hypothetical protein
VTDENEKLELINNQISEAIRIAPYIGKMLSNPNLDTSIFGLTSERDFYLGAMWASAIDFIAVKILKEYRRQPTEEETEIAVKLMIKRVNEFKEAISRLGL